MIDVTGKWTLVTGSSRGVGYRIALTMAQRGSNLILHSRDLAHTDQVLADVKALGVEAYAVEAELSSPDSINKMFDEIDQKGTQVDIIFNDAGVQIAYRTDYFETPVEDFTQSFLINTIAPALITYHFLPGMIERGFGRIINTTSGIKNEPEQAGYSCSKAALDKFTTDLSSVIEGTDVMMNITDPGWCRTDLGGPNAPNDPDSCIPGIVVGAFVDDKKSGRLLHAQTFTGLTLEDAVNKAHTM
ncbi:MAG: SDR family oxidoreductase [Clostridiales Family XIII bacterium]|jgi:short-subunit dehydrogenase|nr:SDR family oxidoreductase [Clostridiales Family XIII bacterium]